MNFNFITNNNKVKIDKKYKVVLFGNEKVNQIDFKKFDKKENSKNNYHKLNKEDSSESESSDSNSYSNSENENNNNENSNDEEDSDKKQDLNENLDINDFLNHNIIDLNLNKNYSSKIENELVLSNTMSISTKDSNCLNSPSKKFKKKKRSKSILKNGGRNSVTKDRQIRRASTKRVSFGASQISFYRSQLFK